MHCLHFTLFGSVFCLFTEKQRSTVQRHPLPLLSPLHHHVHTLVTSQVHPHGQSIFQVFQFLGKQPLGITLTDLKEVGPAIHPWLDSGYSCLAQYIPFFSRTPSCGSLSYIEVEFLHLLPVSASSVVGR